MNYHRGGDNGVLDIQNGEGMDGGVKGLLDYVVPKNENETLVFVLYRLAIYSVER